jgi:lipoate-protein ligase A
VNSSLKIRKADPDEYSEIEKIFEAQGLENNKNGVTLLKGYAVEVPDRIIGGAEVMLQDGEYTFSIAIDDPYIRKGNWKVFISNCKTRHPEFWCSEDHDPSKNS